MKAKVLVIGSGGREHALAWKLSQSEQVEKVFVAPGNAGTAAIADNVPINFTDGPKLLEFAKQNNINLTVIGQEAASEAGVADIFKKAGLLIFGPSQQATRIESSKTFSKDLMKAKQIPTADYENFDNPSEALAYARTRQLPVVVKADGLAAGKGVIICQTDIELREAIDQIMAQKIFGDAGSKVVVEDFLPGQEVSTHALSDGSNFALFPSSQDHKQIYDGDKGPNTGGMGVIAPVPWVTNEHMERIKTAIVAPALEGLRENGSTFMGCLYPGLMVDGPNIQVIEYNARFGDPEAEVYMRLLDGDLYKILRSCAEGTLGELKWYSGYAVSVVIASAGYPASSDKGQVISGITEAEKMPDIVIFHAATANRGEDFVTNGGRVLNVTATGSTLDEALKKAYQAVALIHFEGMQYRTDIGRRQL